MLKRRWVNGTSQYVNGELTPLAPMHSQFILVDDMTIDPSPTPTPHDQHTVVEVRTYTQLMINGRIGASYIESRNVFAAETWADLEYDLDFLRALPPALANAIETVVHQFRSAEQSQHQKSRA